jgi:cobalt transporter subunit CbtA
MIRKMLTSALVAGCAAWLLAVTLHFSFVQKYILLAEEYETGAAVHFAGVASPQNEGDAAMPGASAMTEGSAESVAPVAEAESEPTSNVTRNLWTAVFFGLVYVGYAIFLVAGFGLARIYGKVITAREGLLWGIAGYAAFQIVPAMGMAPELPGVPAADLGARQLWWWGTAIATAIALVLIGYVQRPAALGLAVILLAAPHVIGAPELETFGGVVPPEAAAAFASRVLGMGLAVWAVMGWVAGFVWAREADKPA